MLLPLERFQNELSKRKMGKIGRGLRKMWKIRKIDEWSLELCGCLKIGFFYCKIGLVNETESGKVSMLFSVRIVRHTFNARHDVDFLLFYV